MRSSVLSATVIALALVVGPTFAKSSESGHSSSSPATSGHHSTSSHHSTSASHSGARKSTYAQGVKRDSHGKIARSHSARASFQHSHPCPSTGKTSGACPGYVVDHVTPLKRGGPDAASNMQWQTLEAAKQKDKVE